MCVCGGREAGILHVVNTRIEAGDSLVSFSGPAQLSVAFITESWAGPERQWTAIVNLRLILYFELVRILLSLSATPTPCSS